MAADEVEGKEVIGNAGNSGPEDGQPGDNLDEEARKILAGATMLTAPCKVHIHQERLNGMVSWVARCLQTIETALLGQQELLGQYGQRLDTLEQGNAGWEHGERSVAPVAGAGRGSSMYAEPFRVTGRSEPFGATGRSDGNPDFNAFPLREGGAGQQAAAAEAGTIDGALQPRGDDFAASQHSAPDPSAGINGSRQGQSAAASAGAEQGQSVAASAAAEQGPSVAASAGSKQGQYVAASAGAEQGQYVAASAGAEQGQSVAATAGAEQGKYVAAPAGTVRGHPVAAAGIWEDQALAASADTKQGQSIAASTVNNQVHPQMEPAGLGQQSTRASTREQTAGNRASADPSNFSPSKMAEGAASYMQPGLSRQRSPSEGLQHTSADQRSPGMTAEGAVSYPQHAPADQCSPEMAAEGAVSYLQHAPDDQRSPEYLAEGAASFPQHAPGDQSSPSMTAGGVASHAQHAPADQRSPAEMAEGAAFHAQHAPADQCSPAKLAEGAASHAEHASADQRSPANMAEGASNLQHVAAEQRSPSKMAEAAAQKAGGAAPDALHQKQSIENSLLPMDMHRSPSHEALRLSSRQGDLELISEDQQISSHTDAMWPAASPSPLGSPGMLGSRSRSPLDSHLRQSLDSPLGSRGESRGLSRGSLASRGKLAKKFLDHQENLRRVEDQVRGDVQTLSDVVQGLQHDLSLRIDDLFNQLRGTTKQNIAQASGPGSIRGPGEMAEAPIQREASDNLYISGLPKQISDDGLKEMFEELDCEVVDHKIIADPAGAETSSAMVLLTSKEQASKALESLNGMPSPGGGGSFLQVEPHAVEPSQLPESEEALSALLSPKPLHSWPSQGGVQSYAPTQVGAHSHISQGNHHSHRTPQSGAHSYVPSQDGAHSHMPSQGVAHSHMSVQGDAHRQGPSQVGSHSHMPLQGVTHSHGPQQGDSHCHMTVQGGAQSHMPSQGSPYSHMTMQGVAQSDMPLQGGAHSHMLSHGVSHSQMSPQGGAHSHGPSQVGPHSHMSMQGNTHSHGPMQGDSHSHMTVQGGAHSHMPSQGSSHNHMTAQGGAHSHMPWQSGAHGHMPPQDGAYSGVYMSVPSQCDAYSYLPSQGSAHSSSLQGGTHSCVTSPGLPPRNGAFSEPSEMAADSARQGGSHSCVTSPGLPPRGGAIYESSEMPADSACQGEPVSPVSAGAPLMSITFDESLFVSKPNLESALDGMRGDMAEQLRRLRENFEAVQQNIASKIQSSLAAQAGHSGAPAQSAPNGQLASFVFSPPPGFNCASCGHPVAASQMRWPSAAPKSAHCAFPARSPRTAPPRKAVSSKSAEHRQHEKLQQQIALNEAQRARYLPAISDFSKYAKSFSGRRELGSESPKKVQADGNEKNPKRSSMRKHRSLPALTTNSNRVPGVVTIGLDLHEEKLSIFKPNDRMWSRSFAGRPNP